MLNTAGTFDFRHPMPDGSPELMLGPYLTLLAVLATAFVVVIAAAVLLMTRTLLRPPRMTDGKAAYLLKRLSPGDLDLPFENVSFTVRDEQTGKPLALAAWWIAHPAAGGKCVILLHGYGDAKVGVIAWAPIWRSLGFHILAVDLRAHGESAGRCTTAGFFERHDVSQVIDELRAANPTDTKTLVLFGVSLGAAVALATADMRDDIAAVIGDSPFATYCDAIRARAEFLDMPLRRLIPLIVRTAERFSGARFDEVSPARTLGRVACPVMLIFGQNDPFVSANSRSELKEILTRKAGKNDCWLIDETGHALGIAADPSAYESRLRTFLVNAMVAIQTDNSSDKNSAPPNHEPPAEPVV